MVVSSIGIAGLQAGSLGTVALVKLTLHLFGPALAYPCRGIVDLMVMVSP
jgi:hypothetical protein